MQFALCIAFAAVALGDGLDEFKVKRQDVFAFTAKPSVKVVTDAKTDQPQYEIKFASEAACDVTVTIEDGQGRIVRHMGSGCLGPNAPQPFQKNSLSQTIVWDGKDDKDKYVEKLDAISVRVSLGLEARFERSLFWEPKRRSHADAPCAVATPEGVYVYDGRVYDHVRLFDHQGSYVRTVYPFPADKLEQVKGLHWTVHPQDGQKQAMKEGFHQATFFSCGINAGFDEKIGMGVDKWNNWDAAVTGNAACMMAVGGTRMAIGRMSLNRLATDGSSGGMDFSPGPDITFPIRNRGGLDRNKDVGVSPRMGAFSPDGKYLYLGCYPYGHRTAASRDIVLVDFYDWLPGVARMDWATGKVEPFLGGMKLSDAGDDDSH
ncbi:MAG: hypothetical protein PHU85_18625, partial [Phycisphaerae bacterium]|nr:hypothetical protein [Phycisphaerae bacterium]